MILAISTSGSFVGMEQFHSESIPAAGVYFSDFISCEMKLKRHFGQSDYNGQSSQLYHLPNQQLSSILNAKNQNKIHSCVKLGRRSSYPKE